MNCKCAKYDIDTNRYKCEITDSGCMYLIPDSKQCAEKFTEGPDVTEDEEDGI